MAKARLIYRNLPASDKYNDLYEYENWKIAQLIYHVSYSFSDDWGHLPYSERWIKNTCFPSAPINGEEIGKGMQELVQVKLWEPPYEIDSKKFIYIHKFEVMQREGIRHRRRGEYPDESGKMPIRDKEITIDESIEKSAEIRGEYANHEI